MSLLRAACVLAAALAALPARAQDWQAGAGDDWRQTLERARGEGRVVVSGDSDLARALTPAFKRDTGLDVDFLVGTPRDLAARVTRELRAKAVTIDVMVGGPALIPLHREGLMTAIAPQLVLPGTTDPKYWAGGHIKWIDNDRAHMLMGAEYVNGDPFYNKRLVKPGALDSWRDLLKPEFAGRIAVADPTAPGSGQADAHYIVEKFGVDFLRDVYFGQKAMMTREPRQLIEWLARGTAAVSLGGSSTDLERFRKSGVDAIGVSELADGPGLLTGGFSIVWEPLGAPHPNAAAVFLNWYASKPGQEAFMAAKGTPTRRLDVDKSHVPPYILPKPGVDYFDEYQEDFLIATRPKVERAIEEAMGGR
jgi:ABC-type Fe3+ transport system substrate-binding protein